ncbi:MAG: UDP-N-acetylmuramoyl-L-alanyl-D-glutamate--2,6-diaminopimelate ligase [Candidatus Omnitrophota bacterium]|jgi:UDP-N-acetylmuramyl-tripeptide synthetase
MNLTQVIKSLEGSRLLVDAGDFELSGLSCDSRKTRPGHLFVAVKGASLDGNLFIPEAIKQGAGAVVTDQENADPGLPGNVSIIKVRDCRHALADLAVQFYGDPSAKMRIAAVTGTNGKTTVTYLMEAVLKAAGRAPAVIGTINYRFANRVIPSKNTTPGPLELQGMMAEMLGSGADQLVMEVSSHALAQGRTERIKLTSAIFTNLTQDHLDYHKSAEGYYRAKEKLFLGLSRDAFAVVNNDDKYAARIKGASRCRVVTYGIDQAADITAEDIRLDMEKTEFTIIFSGGKADIKTRLIGRHNVYNILAVFAWAVQEGIGPAVIRQAMEDFTLVPGRLEKVDTGKDICVFVDYAHTEDALKNVLTALRQVCRKRIIVVFGCGGDRDKDKRPKMGSVVSELADQAVLTNDNPRSEDPQGIISDIRKGMKEGNYCVIPDRREAIRKALQIAGKGDCVLIAGKGHEDYQITKDKVIHFDDREAVRECLR